MSDAAQNTEKTGKEKAQALSSRLRAAQAVYQVMQNGESLRDTAAEYLSHRLSMQIDGEELVAPDRELLKVILLGVHETYDDLCAVVDHALTPEAKDGEEVQPRSIDPLLRAVLICASYEIVIRQSEDSPILINDYLNVTHAFYEQGEVSLINGLLDKIAKNCA